MHTRLMPFVCGPGMRIGSGRTQIRHEYWLTNEADGRPLYMHQDEREW